MQRDFLLPKKNHGNWHRYYLEYDDSEFKKVSPVLCQVIVVFSIFLG